MQGVAEKGWESRCVQSGEVSDKNSDEARAAYIMKLLQHVLEHARPFRAVTGQLWGLRVGCE